MIPTYPLRFGALLGALVAPLPAQAETYYVAPPPTGNDSASGSMEQPFASVSRAQTEASPGDTVIIRGGTYAFTGSGTVGVAFTKPGTSGMPIRYFAADGEIPIFDLSDLTPSNRVTGLDINTSWIHIRGLEVTGVHQYMSGQDSWGVRVRGDNNVLENLNVHHNDAPGIFITSGSNNRVVNCDSHHNYDFLEDGGSGDGFGCHSTGDGNVMTGCRGYDNSDDGYDFINAPGSCTVEKSFAFRNGWVPDTTTTAGNGAGFKAGGYGSPPTVPGSGAAEHTVQQCVSFSNRSQGFYANHHPGRINFFNNVAWDNATNYDMLADQGYPSDHVLRNNVAFDRGGNVSRLTGGNDDNNAWNLGVTADAADFLSLAASDALAPRRADGSLPSNMFARLATGSDLIDAGVDVGLPFVGTAPDLGAYEFGAVEDPGTGGSGGEPGVGGSGGSGGAGGSAAAGTAGMGGNDGDAGTAGMAGSSGATMGGGAGMGLGGSAAGTSSVGGALTGAGGSLGAVGGAMPSAGAGSVMDPSAQAEEAGCACQTTRTRGGHGAWALLATLLGFGRRRRAR